MKELLKNLMNLDKPFLTKDLAPKLAPFAWIIYVIALIILAVATLGALRLLFEMYLSSFVLAMLGIFAEFAIVRMFCEYLTSHNKK